jgi:hypothetical protein
MAKQELDLFQLASCYVAEGSARSPQIMRRDPADIRS